MELCCWSASLSLMMGAFFVAFSPLIPVGSFGPRAFDFENFWTWRGTIGCDRRSLKGYSAALNSSSVRSRAVPLHSRIVDCWHSSGCGFIIFAIPAPASGTGYILCLHLQRHLVTLREIASATHKKHLNCRGCRRRELAETPWLRADRRSRILFRHHHETMEGPTHSVPTLDVDVSRASN